MDACKGFDFVFGDGKQYSECQQCKHVHQSGDTCKAFPDGIPEDILMGKVMHHEPYEGDKGYRYIRKSADYLL